MRNVKRLWVMIGCLLLCIVVLVSLIMARPFSKSNQNNTAQLQDRQNHEQIVAKIGNRNITNSELTDGLVAQYGTQLLNQMLDREAIRLEAVDTGIKVENIEIDRELKQMQQGYENEEQFYQSMKDQLGFSKSELRDDVYYKILLEKIATQNIRITEVQVDDYIRSHPDEFKRNVELHIQQIIVTNREQANKVLAEIVKGEDFAILARDRSIDDATANSGGDLGWLEEDDPFVPAIIMNSAKQLKVAEISKPIALDKGFAIIRLQDRKEKQSPDQQFIRDKIRKELALRDAPPLKEIVKKLREKQGTAILDSKFEP